MGKSGGGVVVEGLDELRRLLRQVADKELTDALKAAHKEAAKVVVAKALPNVPVRTGRLKASVRALGSQRSGRAVAGNKAVPYAAAIHWGRSSGNVSFKHGRYSKGQGAITGRPFLWNAAQESLPEIEHAAFAEYRKMWARMGLPLR